MSHVLVVDDEPTICWSFRELLQDEGHAVTVASSAEEAIEAAGRIQPDAVLLDVRLPGMDGLSAIAELRKKAGDVPIIVMTAFGNLETAVQAVEQGAFDYLTKPFEIEDATALITRALSQRRGEMSTESEPLASESDEPIIGSSAAIQRVFKQIALVAQSDVPVLITGESGTGKELVARAIHRHGSRSKKQIVAVSLAALNAASIEGELFGFAKGAIPGSDSARRGLLELASGSTVLLDEIADVPVSVQVKLLRTIERQEIVPVGAVRPKQVDIRVIAVSSRALGPLMESGEFREDLFFRLGVVQIDLPPLRERAEDIPDLANYFLRNCSEGDSPRELTPAALCELGARSWPGNVRELRNTVEHAAIMSRGSAIDVTHLPDAAATSGGRTAGSTDPLLREVRRWTQEKMEILDPSGSEAMLYEDFLQAVEPSLLESVLDRCSGNRAAAARLLGLHRATLRQKLRSHGLDDKAY